MKRTVATSDEENLRFDVDAVLLDIEGTTTSIKFVKETLFPYIVTEVQRHLENTWDTKETQEDVAAILDQVAKDSSSTETDGSCGLKADDGSVKASKSSEKLGGDGKSSIEDGNPPESSTEDVRPSTGVGASSADDRESMIGSVVRAVHEMVEADRKIGCLKQLQGHMWRKGYADGRLKGHLYEDVPESLKRWRASGVKLFIYSSGSVEAQRLLFGHTEYGDLNYVFSGNFDTSSGFKADRTSYSHIADRMDIPVSRVLFVTDIAAEARAAQCAGMKVLLSDRPGNVAGLEDGEHYPTATTFNSVHITNGTSTRKAKRL
uniref:Enolase-phosphatase E1-like isoform X1 n=1 Tax=Hirondellea gigas TaxID=1518452 RepID=A0A6A7G9T8_9CRUS